MTEHSDRPEVATDAAVDPIAMSWDASEPQVRHHTDKPHFRLEWTPQEGWAFAFVGDREEFAEALRSVGDQATSREEVERDLRHSFQEMLLGAVSRAMGRHGLVFVEMDERG